MAERKADQEGTESNPYSEIGFLRTHWDCPECGEPNDREGDLSGEVVKCDAGGCDCHVFIRQVM